MFGRSNISKFLRVHDRARLDGYELSRRVVCDVEYARAASMDDLVRVLASWPTEEGWELRAVDEEHLQTTASIRLAPWPLKLLLDVP